MALLVPLLKVLVAVVAMLGIALVALGDWTSFVIAIPGGLGLAYALRHYHTARAQSEERRGRTW